MENDRKHWVVLGRVVRVHGVRGALRVRWYSPLDALLAPPAELLLTAAQGGAGQVFAVEALREQGAEGALVQLVGLGDIEAATPWRGAEVRVPRALVPAAQEGEVYLFELLGREVYNADGTLLGRAQNLYDYGAGPLLGILPPLAPAAEDLQAEAGAKVADEPGEVGATRPRRGKRKRKASAVRRDEVLLPLLPKVLRELDLAAERVVVNTDYAGLEET